MGKTSLRQLRSAHGSAARAVGEYVTNINIYSNSVVESNAKAMPNSLPSYNVGNSGKSGQYQTTSSSSRESYRTLNTVLSGHKSKR